MCVDDAPGVRRFGIGQDIAVTIAFLITELAELSMVVDPSAPVAIVMSRSGDRATATLDVRSSALVATTDLTARLAGRYARALEGFSRQLRAPLTHDPSGGTFTIEFALYKSARKP